MLGAIAGLLGLAHALHWEWLGAFCEAALVGGLADWFAVTALFRHPLGLPIPHTAIIPENRDRIAESMAGFLHTHFLAPANVARRLGALNPAAALGRLMATPGRAAGRRGRSGLTELLSDARLGAVIRPALRDELARLDLATALSRMLGVLVEQGHHRTVVEALLTRGGQALETHAAMLRQLIAERADNVLLRVTGLDQKLANLILDGLCRLLAEAVANPAHPLRQRLEGWLVDLSRDLAQDPATRAKVAAIKAEMLASPAMASWLDGIWDAARAAMLHPAAQAEQGLVARLNGMLAQQLARDPTLQRLVNRLARRLIAGLVARHGDAIASLVSGTVKRWNTATLTARLEGAVGRDLQFIRLNGTLVGGLVGLGLHAISLLW